MYTWYPWGGVLENRVRHRNVKNLLSITGLLASLLFFGFSLGLSPASAQSDGDVDLPVAGKQSFGAHLAAVATGVGESDSEALSQSVSSIEGVSSVSVDTTADDTVVYFVWAENDWVDRDGLQAIGTEISAIVDADFPQSEVRIGGATLTDSEIGSRFGTSAWFVGLAVAIAGLLASLLFGWRRALLATVCAILAVGVAGEFGTAVAGSFNGTVATTALPAVLVGAVVAVVVALRLLGWSDQELGGDNASKVRAGIAQHGPEVAMVVACLFVLSGIAELAQSGRSALTVAAVGAAIAALTVFALLPAGLVLLGDARPADATEFANVSAKNRLPIRVPDGADQPLIYLVAGAGLLVVLAALAFSDPGRRFLDSDSLPTDSEFALVGERLAAVGDQTAPVKATFETTASDELVSQWAAQAAKLPNVVRVETTSDSFGYGGAVNEDISFSSDAFAGEEPVAFVIPSVVTRSEKAQATVVELANLDLALGNPQLSGLSVDATTDGPSRTGLLILIVAASVLVGLGVLVTTQSRAFGLTAGLLRLLFSGAIIGLYRLVVPEATGAELVLVLAVVTAVAALCDFEFLEQLPMSGRTRPKPILLSNPGETALIGIAFLGLACVMLLLAAFFGGGPTVGRLGFGLLFAALLEGAMGGFVSRPALLGQSGAFHSAARPMRVAFTSSKRMPGPDEIEGDPHWKRVVSDLLQSEYQLQVNPEVADVSQVFVADTPLARQAQMQSQSLHEAGLRISGRSPRLRRVTTISQQSPISLGVIVEHPTRQLVGPDGAVVGVRKAELKRGVLWLVEREDGTHRIAESVELETSDPNESTQDLSFSSESLIETDQAEDNGYSIDVVTDESPTIVVTDGKAELSLTETSGGAGAGDVVTPADQGTESRGSESDQPKVGHRASRRNIQAEEA